MGLIPVCTRYPWPPLLCRATLKPLRHFLGIVTRRIRQWHRLAVMPVSEPVRPSPTFTVGGWLLGGYRIRKLYPHYAYFGTLHA
jgi:hypothetical protein